MKRLLAALAAAATIFTAGAATAQTFPDRPITMVVPFRAGGPTDTVGRLLSQAMSRNLGVQVQVQIVDGAGGTLGAQRVAEAAPDGYTILLYHVGMATTPTLYPNLGYDPLTDFAEIGLVTNVPMTLVGRQRLPVSTWEQLIAYMTNNIDRITMAHAGIGSASHLCAMLFSQLTGLDIVTVPFVGTAEAMLDLQADFVDFMCDQTTSTVAPIQSGSVIAYAVTSPVRLQQIPDVPTPAEVGLPGFQLDVWHGLWAPAGTPPEVVARLNEALRFALTDQQVLRTFALFATNPSPIEDQTPEALRAKVASEIELWRPLIEAAGEFVR
ncbi:MAG: tripartite tricarboxylate transporter substrate binding protein BugD [Bauldia sp.]|nr:tripartite tricarboxylate transporter substrate binding protein BugD [Bauldia sp.]MCW5716743.1 tripartite tricarboxylate transporter substrate binding protein BugD [Bauldia sp.]